MARDAVILGFDTSAAHCAAAVLCDGQVTERCEDMDKGQAERLIPLLDEVLAQAGVAWSDLTAIAVGTGPGNFTGVRISVAAARGLALSLGIPAIGITRFDALAHGLPTPFAVAEDARRDEVYLRLPDHAAELIAATDLPARVAGLPVVGSAAAMAGGVVLTPPQSLVAATVQVAATRLDSPQPRPAPFYLRGADAAPPADPPPVILP